MSARADALPAVKIDAKEDRFGEERETFERERHPDNRARIVHKTGPQQTQLERQHRTGDRADGKEYRRALRPTLRKLQVNVFPRPEPAPLGDDH